MNNKLEESFSNKINWKFVNYLVDKLTIYEDIGLDTNVSIYTKCGTTYKFIYNNKRNYYQKDEYYESISYYWELTGLYYAVVITNPNASSFETMVDEKKTAEFYDRIKNKCTIRSKYNLKFLMVVPNE